MEGHGLLPGGYQYPPGFRFHPTDQELIIHYLSKKVTSSLSPAASIIAEIDLYKFNPWELPGKAFFGEGEWFFFSPRDRKYPNGARPNRAAGSGYWKATGTDKPILAVGGAKCLGVKKALVFYKGRPPKGIKTDWVMHEYRLLDGNPSWPQKHKGSMRLDDWVLCRVRQKGSLPLQAEEKHEGSNLPHPFTIQPAEKQATRERENPFQWSDYQLLAYLMGSGSAEEGESACENSDPGSAKSSGGNGGGLDAILGGCGGAQQQQQEQQQQQQQQQHHHHQVPSVFDSMMKRSLSFGGLDEIMLVPPSKRRHCSSSVGEQSSPSESASVEQVFPEFMM